MALSYSDLEGLWIAAGGPANVANIAAAITFPESSANPGAIQQGQPYSTTGWGLWQITPGNSVPSVGTDRQLLDPLTNARAAVIKYNGAIAAGRPGFSPWTTYNNGAYRAYLQGGVPPNLNAGGAGGVTGNPATGGGVQPVSLQTSINSTLARVGNYLFIFGAFVGGFAMVIMGLMVLVSASKGEAGGAVVRAATTLGGGARRVVTPKPSKPTSLSTARRLPPRRENNPPKPANPRPVTPAKPVSRTKPAANKEPVRYTVKGRS